MYNFVIGMASMYIRLLLHVCADLSLSANLVLFCFEPTPDATCCWCWRCPDAVAIVVVLGSVVYYCCCCCNYCSVCCCCHFTRCCCYSCCSGLWCCYCCCCLCKAQDAVKYSHKWGQKLKLKWRQSFSMHAQVCVFVCVSVGVSGKHPLIPSQGRVCHVKPGRVQKLKIMQIEVLWSSYSTQNATKQTRCRMSEAGWAADKDDEKAAGKGVELWVEQTANSCFWATTTISGLSRSTLCSVLYPSLSLPATWKSLDPGPLMMSGI